MAPNTDRLTPDNAPCVAGLAAGLTPVDAGQAVGISGAVRRHGCAKVRVALHQAQDDAWATWCRLNADSRRMLDVLLSIARDTGRRRGARLGVPGVARYGIQGAGVLDLAERMGGLERRLQEKNDESEKGSCCRLRRRCAEQWGVSMVRLGSVEARGMRGLSLDEMEARRLATVSGACGEIRRYHALWRKRRAETDGVSDDVDTMEGRDKRRWR